MRKWVGQDSFSHFPIYFGPYRPPNCEPLERALPVPAAPAWPKALPLLLPVRRAVCGFVIVCGAWIAAASPVSRAPRRRAVCGLEVDVVVPAAENWLVIPPLPVLPKFRPPLKPPPNEPVLPLRKLLVLPEPLRVPRLPLYPE